MLAAEIGIDVISDRVEMVRLTTFCNSEMKVLPRRVVLTDIVSAAHNDISSRN